MKKLYAMLAMAFLLPLGSALASDAYSADDALNNADVGDPMSAAQSWQTTTTINRTDGPTRIKPRSVGKRKSNVPALRAEAIKISMRYLPRLRPYASNYPRLVSAVRAYWRNNTTNPNAARLTSMIMQHVKAKYRIFVRSRLRAGVAKGINALKNKLRKS